MPTALLIFGSSPVQVGHAPAGTVKLVRAMLDAGWAIDVLGFRAERDSPNDPFFAEQVVGARTHETPSLLGKPAAWVPGAVLKGRRLLAERRPDIVVSFADKAWAHVAALLIVGRRCLPWVAFFSDPWSNHPMARMSRLRRAVERALERRTLARADALVFTNRKLQEWIIGQRPDRDRIAAKCVSIPYFFDRMLYPPANGRPSRDGLLIRHMGNTPLGTYVPALLEALALMRAEQPDLWRSLTLEFYSSHRPAHGEAVRRLGLDDRIRFLPGVPYRQSLGLMCEADVLLLLTLASRDLDGLGKATLFVKMADYLGAGRPIFALADEGSPTFEALASTGGVCAAVEPSAIKDALTKFLSAPRPPDPEICLEFSKDRVYPRWQRLFESLMNERVPPR